MLQNSSDDQTTEFDTIRADLARLAQQALLAAQSSSTSAAPELLDGLEQLLHKVDRWNRLAEGTPHRRRSEWLLRSGRRLVETLRNLPLDLDTT